MNIDEKKMKNETWIRVSDDDVPEGACLIGFSIGWTDWKGVLGATLKEKAISTILIHNERGSWKPALNTPILTFPLIIDMPCGNVYIIKSINDMPEKSVKCPCGKDKHWIVYYPEEFEKVGDPNGKK